MRTDNNLLTYMDAEVLGRTIMTKVRFCPVMCALFVVTLLDSWYLPSAQAAKLCPQTANDRCPQLEIRNSRRTEWCSKNAKGFLSCQLLQSSVGLPDCLHKLAKYYYVLFALIAWNF